MESNNCQHFVRDIVAIFDIEMANKLTSLLLSNNATMIILIIPAVALLGLQLAEEVRTKKNECNITAKIVPL